MGGFDVRAGLAAASGDQTAITKLISQLHSADAGVRAHATEFLGVSNDPRAVEHVLAMLNDDKLEVRSAAALALGNLQDRRAVPPLIEALRDTSWGVFRQSIARALGNLADVRAMVPLIEVLGDGIPMVRASAASALAKIGDAAAIGPLIDLLVGIGPRGLVSTALSEFGADAVTPLIKLLAQPDKDVRFFAADALSRIRDGRAVGALASLLSDPYIIVRKKATQALVNIGTPAVPRLIQSLGETNQGVRLAACEALGLIGDGQAIEPLKQLTEDQDDLVAASAADALAKIGA